MFNIALCDDDPMMLQIVSEKIAVFLRGNNIEHKIYSFTDSGIFWADAAERLNLYDVFILDLEMPGLGGPDLVKQIKSRLSTAYIILLTCHEQYVFDGYEWGVNRFISKSNYEGRLFSALLKIYDLVQSDKEYYLYHSKDGLQKIYYRDILYITKYGKNSIIHTQKNKETARTQLKINNLSDAYVHPQYHESIQERVALHKLYERLPHDIFYFTCRGCIANINHIVSFNHGTDMLLLSDSSEIAIAKAKIPEIMGLMNDRWCKGV